MRYGFKLLTFHAYQDAKGFRLSISRVTKRRQSRHSPWLILLLHRDTVQSSSMMQKYYENGVIVFCEERSFRMCVSDFCLEKRQIPHEDKSLNPQLKLAVAQSAAPSQGEQIFASPSLRHHRLLSSC